MEAVVCIPTKLRRVFIYLHGVISKIIRSHNLENTWSRITFYPFKYEAQTALFKDPDRTAQ